MFIVSKTVEKWRYTLEAGGENTDCMVNPYQCMGGGVTEN